MAEDDAPDRGMLQLTYREIGERIGRSPDAARQIAIRRGWRVSKGNDGSHRVAVPAHEVGEERAASPVVGRDSDALAALIDDLGAWRVAAEAAREDAATARAQLAATERLVERLERDVDMARRPWWRRWVG